MSARFGGGEVMAYFWWSKKFLSPPPDPPLSQKFADLLTILKFADLRLPTPVFWSSHMYAHRIMRKGELYIIIFKLEWFNSSRDPHEPDP